MPLRLRAQSHKMAFTADGPSFPLSSTQHAYRGPCPCQANNMQERLTELRRTVYLLHYQLIERMRQEGLDGGGMQDEVYGKSVELQSLQVLPSPELIHVHHP